MIRILNFIIFRRKGRRKIKAVMALHELVLFFAAFNSISILATKDSLITRNSSMPQELHLRCLRRSFKVRNKIAHSITIAITTTPVLAKL